MSVTRDTLRREIGRLRKFAYSLTGNMADADDVVQDVVVKVLEKGLPEEHDAVPWLITLCKNTWIDHLRYREVRNRQSGNDTTTESAAQSSQLTEHVEARRVLEALNNLPESQRLALAMVAVEGMSYAETARALEVPIGTVMSRVARARENMLKTHGFVKEVNL